MAVGEKDLAAVGSSEAFLGGVTIELAADLADELRMVGGCILGQALLEDRAADEFLRRIAQQCGQIGIDAL